MHAIFYFLGILKNIHNIVMLAVTINYKLKCTLELILSALFITENVSFGPGMVLNHEPEGELERENSNSK